MPAAAANTAAARSAAEPEGAKAPAWLSYDFSIKWLTPFYPANPSQAAGSGEKCMDLRFLRLRRRLLKQQPNKTVFNRFIKATPHNCVCESQPSFLPHFFSLKNEKYSAAVASASWLTDAAYPLRVHTVFLRFPNFELGQKSCLRLLAELCGAALKTSIRRRTVKKDQAAHHTSDTHLIFERRQHHGKLYRQHERGSIRDQSP